MAAGTQPLRDYEELSDGVCDLCKFGCNAPIYNNCTYEQPKPAYCQNPTKDTVFFDTPQQLQGEVERDSWFLASADSGTLLKELLRQGPELPPPAAVSSGAVSAAVGAAPTISSDRPTASEAAGHSS